MDRRNDISFALDGKFIVLLEHQSSINPNMPLRFLLYVSPVYDKLIDRKGIYKEKLIKIPVPQFIVLYNGTKDFPEEKILKLSDAFIGSGDVPINLELEVRVVNINYGKSQEILAKSQTLNDYSYFVHRVKQNRKAGIELDGAIEGAVRECIREGRLKDFLEEHGTEVVNMLNTVFDIEDAKQVWQEEAREEAREERNIEIAVSLLHIGKLDDKMIAEITGLSLEEIRKLHKKS